MKKHKGVALPTAIALCSFLLLVSISLGTILLMNSANNRVSRVKSNHEIIYLQSYNQFINEEEITDKTFNWETYIKEDNVYIKALAAYTKSDNLSFYSIYDFENNELLAYQTSSFYIKTVGEDIYLGGLVKVNR